MVSTSRPRTPSASTTTSPSEKPTAIPERNQPPRRSSLGLLLRRTKSGAELSKKQKAVAKEAELQRQQREAGKFNFRIVITLEIDIERHTQNSMRQSIGSILSSYFPFLLTC